MNKILIITNSFDLTCDYIINKFSDNIIFFRFNTDKFYDYNIQITLQGSIIEYKDKNSSINVLECDGIYYRKITLPELNDYEPKYIQLMQSEMLTVINGIAEITGERSITRPSIIRKADNKVVQLKIAREVGFTIPQLLITNSESAAKIFCNNVQSIIKPISIGKIITDNKVGFIQTNLVNTIYTFEGLSSSPSYFQLYKNKDYEVRLTIVGNKLFGVRIDSTNKIDWRKENAVLKYSNIEVPSHIAEKCLKMMRRLNLCFATFDFIVNNNEYFFLELNANGQWLWLEEQLNLNISDAIVNYLIGDNCE